jgi:hypothetical protein
MGGMRDISLNTDDLETLLGLGVDKVLAINLKRLQGQRRTSQGTGGREETTGGLLRNRASVRRVGLKMGYLCAYMVHFARDRLVQHLPQPS